MIDRIFDPFFATKPQGKGTGLGLATTLGIVRSYGGDIAVYSKPGNGTMFSIYLPASKQLATKSRLPEADAPIAIGNGETILVVDDESLTVDTAREALVANNYHVATASDGLAVIEKYQHNGKQIELVLLDMMMPGLDGFETKDALRRHDPNVRVIASSAMSFPDDEVIICLSAKAGIAAFLKSTPDVVLCDLRLPDMSGMEAFDPDTLIRLIEDAAETSRMTRVPALIPDEAIDEQPVDASTDLLIGSCPAMQEVYRSIGRVARQNVTALILGESGTGKEAFERVGGSETIRTNARIIAATNRNLEQAIQDKEFRSDLFYRFNVYTIKLPPLRDRGDDIAILATYFLRRFAADLGKEITGFAKESMDQLIQYRWPGNVRELQSVVKHALLDATGPVIAPSFLPDFRRESTSPGAGTLSASSSSPSGSLGGLDFAALTRQRLREGSENIHHELIGIGITRTTLRARLESLGLRDGELKDRP